MSVMRMELETQSQEADQVPEPELSAHLHQVPKA